MKIKNSKLKQLLKRKNEEIQYLKKKLADSENISLKEKLKESQRKFEEIFNQTYELMGILSIDGILLDANISSLKMIKTKKEDVLNKPFWETPWWNHSKELQEKLKQLVKKSSKGENVTSHAIHYDSNRKAHYIEFSIFAVKDNKGKVQYLIALGKDISERKLAEEEQFRLINELTLSIEKEQAAYEEMEAAYNEMEITQEKLEKALIKAQDANRLKTEFLAIMSHELRTPLSGMIGFSHLLVNDETLSDEQKENVDYIYQSGKRLLTLLSDLLELSSIEAGKFKIEMSFFNIEKLIDDVYILFKDQLIEKNITFKSKLHGIKNIYSDESRIRQVLFNLMGNAVKFIHKGQITINLSQKKDNYIFEIKDTGIGISEDNKKSIFDMFKQVESAFKRKYSGAGLGLAICQKLVNALDGKIWLESKLNKGSSFYFSIPKLIDEETKITIGIMQNENIVFEKPIKIIYVEDDEINFNYLNKVLSTENNFKTKGFTSGNDFIKEVNEVSQYDIALLDIQMPKINGEECLRIIKNINKNIIVIAVTAFAGNNNKKKYLKMGFDGYVSKPFFKEKLLSTIYNYINRRKVKTS